MAISYVGGVGGARAGSTSTTTQSLSGTLTGGSNTSPSAGDLVVVFCAVGSDGSGTPTSQTISGNNSGAYTTLTFQGTSATTYDSTSQVNYKIQGTVDTTLTIPSSGNNRNAQAWVVHVFRDVDPTTPLDVTSTYATGTATGRPNPALIAPSTAGAWICAFYASAAATGTAYTAPTDFATDWRGTTQADTADVMIGAGYYTGWTSGNYDPAAISAGGTTGANDSWTTTTIALRPFVATAPTVTTQAVSSISYTTATGNGNVTSDGGDTITERGVCWNTSGTPTTSDSKNSTGGGTTGAYTRSMTGLSSDTHYYVRAYAINAIGTSYGTTVEFDTLNYPPTVVADSPLGYYTYYFNASDAGPTDSGGVWTNDANAFDGSTATTATASSAGNTSSNFLLGEGTNAPTSGGAILEVRARLYGAGSGSISPRVEAAIYTDGLGELLGTAVQYTTVDYGSYVTLTEPTGGWTWQKLNDLEVKIYGAATSGFTAAYIRTVEVEVFAPTETSDTTPDLLFTGTDTESDDIRYNVQVDTDSAFGAVATYYFDASDGGPTDVSGVWTNDANAFDGSTATAATTGSVGAIYDLLAEGTNAPSSGGVISQVRVRAYGDGGGASDILRVYVYTDTQAEMLGTVDVPFNGPTWSSYATLSTPSGGWTWAKLQSLETKIQTAPDIATSFSLRAIEIEVTEAVTVDVVSGTDSGFSGSPDNTDPFASAQQVTYTAGVYDSTYSFYFDGNLGSTDDGFWASDANAYDGSTSTYANNTSGSNDTLKIKGTTATGISNILQVRVRAYGSQNAGFVPMDTYIKTSTGESLGGISIADTATPIWSSWWTLPIPTGGWSLSVLQSLESWVTHYGLDHSGESRMYRIEFEVDTYLPLDAGTYYWRVRGIDPSGSNTYGAWSDTEAFTISSGTTIVPQDASWTFVADADTITQNHVLTPNDASFIFIADNDTISQNHIISANDSQFTFIADATTIAESYNISANDSQFTFIADATTIAQNHVLTANDSAWTFVADATTIAQNHIFTPNDSFWAFIADSDTITQGHTIATQDSFFTFAADATTIAQSHVIAAQDSFWGFFADNDTITQNHILAPADSAWTFFADSTVVSLEGSTIITQDAFWAFAADASSVTPHLVVNDASWNFVADAATINQNHVLTAADSFWGLFADAASIAQTHVIAGNDAAFIFIADSDTITQGHVVATQDSFFSFIADNDTITQAHTIVTQDGTFAFFADAATINQNHVLTGADAAFTFFADNTTISEVNGLVPANAFWQFIADASTITQNHVLSPSDSQFTFVADTSSISQAHLFDPNRASFEFIADTTTISETNDLVPTDAAWTFAADSDTITQGHTLATQDAFWTLFADTATMSQNHVLTASDSQFTFVADTTSLIQNFTVAPNDASWNFAADSSSVSQIHSITGQDSTFNFVADTDSITQNHLLSPVDSFWAFVADADIVTQNHLIYPADSTFTFFADTTTMSQNHVLSGVDSFWSFAADSTTVDQTHVVSPDDSFFSFIADAAGVLSGIVPQAANLQFFADNDTITQLHIIETGDTFFLFAADTSTVLQTHLVVPNDGYFGFFADTTTVALNYTFETVDAFWGFFADPTRVRRNKSPAKGYVSTDTPHGHVMNEIYQGSSLSKPTGGAFRDGDLTIMEDMTDIMESPAAFMGAPINRGEMPHGAIVLGNEPKGELPNQE